MKKFRPYELVFIGMLVLLPLLMFVLVIKPRYDVQKNMSKMATSLNTTYGEFIDVRQTAVNCLEDDKKALEEVVEGTRKRLSKGRDSGEILGGLATMVRENNLILKDVEPVSRGLEGDSGTLQQRYGFQRIDIELEGTFEGLYNFLIALEDYEQIIHIDTMELELNGVRSNDGGRTAEALVNADLGLVIYYEKISENSEDSK